VSRTGTYYADGQALDAAESELTSRCMAAHGFRYPAGSPSASRDEEWRPDLSERRRRGYGLQDASSSQQRDNDRYVRGLPPARQADYTTALFGKPADHASITLPDGTQPVFTTRGCLADSRTRIYGSPADAALVSYLPQLEYITAYTAVRRSPRYTSTLRRWSACMARHGDRYSSPGDAKRQLSAQYRTDRPAVAHRHEIAVAVADARCAAAVGLPAVVEAMLRDHAASLPPAQRAELHAVAIARIAAAGKARRLASP
jgi:hypothetical protein